MGDDIDIYRLLSRGNSKFFSQKPDLYFPVLTDVEYNKGDVNRYFIRPANDPNSAIMEINETEYRVFITNPFYTGVILNWKITGPLDTIIINGIVNELGISEYNFNQLKKAEQSLSGMIAKLKDLHQFYKPD
jgi:hypothetical protein